MEGVSVLDAGGPNPGLAVAACRHWADLMPGYSVRSPPSAHEDGTLSRGSLSEGVRRLVGRADRPVMHSNHLRSRLPAK